MLHGKSWRFGVKLFGMVREHAVLGFSRTYESDDPLFIKSLWVEDIEATDLDLICKVAGLVLISTTDQCHFVGRRSVVRTVAEELERGPLNGEPLMRGFMSDYISPRSVEFQEKLEKARATMINHDRLAHFISEHFAIMRDWGEHGQGRADHYAQEIIIQKRVTGFTRGGVELNGD